MSKLPPLPEPDLLPVTWTFDAFCANRGAELPDRCHSADQLRSYGQACWEAAIEAAAKRVQDEAAKWDGPYRRAADLLPPLIRSMKEPQ